MTYSESNRTAFGTLREFKQSRLTCFSTNAREQLLQSRLRRFVDNVPDFLLSQERVFRANGMK